MSGKKERVKLTIIGRQQIEGEENREEFTASAECLREGADFYLFYEEWVEEHEVSAKCLIKWADGKLERIRKGTPGIHMVFEKGCLHEMDYPTPYGLLPLGIRTQQTEYREEKDGFCVCVAYQLEREQSILSEHKLEIRVRQEGKFEDS